MSRLLIDRRSTLGLAAAALTLPRATWAAPQARKHILGFYYRGYGNPQTSGTWKRWIGPTGKENPKGTETNDHPLLGMYDVDDPAVLQQHAVWARQAGLTGLIFGYWTRAGWEDHNAGQRMLDAMHGQGLTLSAYLEHQKNGVAQQVDDFRYLTPFMAHPAWAKMNGRPVFLMYGGAFKDMPAADWRQAAKTYAAEGHPEPMLIADVDPDAPGYADKLKYLDGTHQYTLSDKIQGMTPEQVTAFTDAHYPSWKAKTSPKIYCATVEPGWNDLKILTRKYPRPTTDRFGVETLSALWRAAIKVRADMVVVSTFNDWMNSTEIEPSREWGDAPLMTTARFAGIYQRQV